MQSIIPLVDYKRNKQGAIKLTTGRYYTPSGKSIQAKGIEPDIVIEQGKFESSELKLYSESDLIGSLDKELLKKENENNDNKPNLVVQDYQLSRAVDLITALSIINSSSIN